MSEFNWVAFFSLVGKYIKLCILQLVVSQASGNQADPGRNRCFHGLLYPDMSHMPHMPWSFSRTSFWVTLGMLDRKHLLCSYAAHQGPAEGEARRPEHQLRVVRDPCPSWAACAYWDPGFTVSLKDAWRV